jgi:2-furoyl-CoA dehydrogenase large subunit
VCGAAHLAAVRIKARLARLAAAQLNVAAEEIEFVAGRARARGNPDNALPFARLAAAGHWAPGTLPADVEPAIRETVFWTPPELAAPTDADEVNSSLCHGFIFDICGLEVDRTTGAVHIDHYTTMHDCGRILHPAMVAGQITGGFAQALGAALYEEFAYAPDGSPLTGTLADYLIPTAMEVPAPHILHVETPSPFTPLGAKGVGEGNSMSTPVCIANAVADALNLDDVELPLTPARLAAIVHPRESPSREGTISRSGDRGRTLSGTGLVRVAAPVATVWHALLKPQILASIIPGCEAFEAMSATHFCARVALGIGPVQGRYRAEVRLTDLVPARSATLAGSASGGLGWVTGTGMLTLAEEGAHTTVVAYSYQAEVGGKAAAIGGRLLDAAARAAVRQFFEALARRIGAGSLPLWRRALHWLPRADKRS